MKKNSAIGFAAVFCAALGILPSILAANGAPPVYLKLTNGGLTQTCALYDKGADLKVTPAVGDVLYCSCGVDPGGFSARKAAFVFSIKVTSGDTSQIVFTRTLRPFRTRRDMGWTNQEIPLDPFAGHPISIQFLTEADPKTIALSSFTVPVDLEAHMFWGGVRAGNFTRKNSDLNVILISIDTLRADHLGVAGYARPTTPNLDLLARGGVYFRKAVAQAPWTLPSHISVFTGLYPAYNGMMRLPGFPDLTHRELALKIPTFTQVIQRNGYLTQAVTGDCFVSAIYGFDRGFDRFVETSARRGSDAAFVFSHGFRWLEKNKDKKFFLFLHTYECHAPYTRDTFVNSLVNPTPQEISTARYDSDILFVDNLIGSLREKLDELGLTKNTLVVVMSDHGEDLGDRPYPPNTYHKHGNSLFDEITRVLLIFSLPGRLTPRIIDDYPGRLIDIAPTILDMLGLPFETSDPLSGGKLDTAFTSPKIVLQGRSLVKVLKKGRGDGEVLSLSEAMLSKSERKALRYTAPHGRGGYDDVKAIYHAGRKDFQFYNLKKDPKERNPVPSAEDGPLFEKLKTILTAYMDGAPRPSDLIGESKAMDPEVSEELHSLGY